MPQSRPYWRSEDGATATEYLILSVFIAIAIIVGVSVIGVALNEEFSEAGSKIENPN